MKPALLATPYPPTLSTEMVALARDTTHYHGMRHSDWARALCRLIAASLACTGGSALFEQVVADFLEAAYKDRPCILEKKLRHQGDGECIPLATALATMRLFLSGHGSALAGTVQNEIVAPVLRRARASKPLSSPSHSLQQAFSPSTSSFQFKRPKPVLRIHKQKHQRHHHHHHQHHHQHKKDQPRRVAYTPVSRIVAYTGEHDDDENNNDARRLLARCGSASLCNTLLGDWPLWATEEAGTLLLIHLPVPAHLVWHTFCDHYKMTATAEEEGYIGLCAEDVRVLPLDGPTPQQPESLVLLPPDAMLVLQALAMRYDSVQRRQRTRRQAMPFIAVFPTKEGEEGEEEEEDEKKEEGKVNGKDSMPRDNDHNGGIAWHPVAQWLPQYPRLVRTWFQNTVGQVPASSTAVATARYHTLATLCDWLFPQLRETLPLLHVDDAYFDFYNTNLFAIMQAAWPSLSDVQEALRDCRFLQQEQEKEQEQEQYEHEAALTSNLTVGGTACIEDHTLGHGFDLVFYPEEGEEAYDEDTESASTTAAWEQGEESTFSALEEEAAAAEEEGEEETAPMEEERCMSHRNKHRTRHCPESYVRANLLNVLQSLLYVRQPHEIRVDMLCWLYDTFVMPKYDLHHYSQRQQQSRDPTFLSSSCSTSTSTPTSSVSMRDPIWQASIHENDETRSARMHSSMPGILRSIRELYHRLVEDRGLRHGWHLCSARQTCTARHRRKAYALYRAQHGRSHSGSSTSEQLKAWNRWQEQQKYDPEHDTELFLGLVMLAQSPELSVAESRRLLTGIRLRPPTTRRKASRCSETTKSPSSTTKEIPERTSTTALPIVQRTCEIGRLSDWINCTNVRPREMPAHYIKLQAAATSCVSKQWSETSEAEEDRDWEVSWKDKGNGREKVDVQWEGEKKETQTRDQKKQVADEVEEEGDEEEEDDDDMKDEEEEEEQEEEEDWEADAAYMLHLLASLEYAFHRRHGSAGVPKPEGGGTREGIKEDSANEIFGQDLDSNHRIPDARSVLAPNVAALVAMSDDGGQTTCIDTLGYWQLALSPHDLAILPEEAQEHELANYTIMTLLAEHLTAHAEPSAVFYRMDEHKQVRMPRCGVLQRYQKTSTSSSDPDLEHSSPSPLTMADVERAIQHRNQRFLSHDLESKPRRKHMREVSPQPPSPAAEKLHPSKRARYR